MAERAVGLPLSTASGRVHYAATPECLESYVEDRLLGTHGNSCSRISIGW